MEALAAGAAGEARQLAGGGLDDGVADQALLLACTKGGEKEAEAESWNAWQDGRGSWREADWDVEVTKGDDGQAHFSWPAGLGREMQSCYETCDPRATGPRRGSWWLSAS